MSRTGIITTYLSLRYVVRRGFINIYWVGEAFGKAYPLCNMSLVKAHVICRLDVCFELAGRLQITPFF